MKATTTQVANTIRKQAIETLSLKLNLPRSVVIECIEARHKRLTDAFDALVSAAIECTLQMVDSGHVELVTG